MKKLSFILLIALSVVCNAQSWRPVYKSPGPLSGGFYEYLPKGYDGQKKFPVIVFLHGLGETGNGDSAGLAKLKTVGLPSTISIGRFPTSFDVAGQLYSFIVICPQFRAWPGVNEVSAVINYTLANYPVDTDRIYLTGLSMGGGGTWDYAGASLANAQRLAAIVPVCGASSVNQAGAKNIADAGLAVWATHNQDDAIVGVGNTIGWTNGINAYLPRIMAMRTIWPTGGHNAWGATYDPGTKLDGVNNAFEWMLKYKRGAAVVQPPIGSPSPFSPIKVSAGLVAGWTIDRQFLIQQSGNSGNKAVDIWGFNPAISGTATPELYQTENFGSMEYRFQVPPGDYTVRLHFAELFWNAAAKRLFHVDAEGQRVITSLDIWSAAGGRFRALQRSFDVTVTDGVLNIAFVKGAADNPKISGIEVNQRGAIVIPPGVNVVTVEYRDSATNALIRAKTDTFSAPVTVVVKQ